MLEPGFLSDFNDAAVAAWQRALGAGGDSGIVRAPDQRTRQPDRVEWTGGPTRIVKGLGWRVAVELLDRRRDLQEEYLEWRSVREDDGTLRRVELTTELRDYWLVLAACLPARVVDLASRFSGRAVRPEELFGVARPGSLDPEARRAGFVETMIARSNPLNDGREAICFMANPNNDLRSLLALASAAAKPWVVDDPITDRRRPATAAEMIPALDGAAVAERSSDPVIVERLGRIAVEQRRLALADPLGIYIQGVAASRLRTPDGAPPGPEWFKFGRGVRGAEAPDRRPRTQRLVVEAPPGARFRLGDLVDRASEQPIRYGAQIAELVQLCLFLRIGEPGSAPPRRPLPLPALGAVRGAVRSSNLAEIEAAR